MYKRQGILFTSNNTTAKQFILSANPDSFYSTEHINLENTKSYLIAGFPVVSVNSLGPTVTQSNLTRLGTLVSLDVAGATNLAGTISVDKGVLTITDGTVINTNSVSMGNTLQNVSISTKNISFGTKEVPTTDVVVNGTLAVGIQNISSDVNFETSGNFRFANRLFAVGVTVPSSGSFKKGDIVWNSNPVETGYVGWICVTDGTPGIWRSFGQIGVE